MGCLWPLVGRTAVRGGSIALDVSRRHKMQTLGTLCKKMISLIEDIMVLLDSMPSNRSSSIISFD